MGCLDGFGNASFGVSEGTSWADGVDSFDSFGLEEAPVGEEDEVEEGFGSFVLLSWSFITSLVLSQDS